MESFIEKLQNNDNLKSLTIKVFSAFAMLMFVFAVVTGCAQNASNKPEQNDIPISQTENEGVKVGNDGVNAGIAKDDDDVTIVSQGRTISDGMVAMSIEDYGRPDPFLPASEQIITKAKPSVSYDLLPPPEIITTDTTATEVITTTVSGIMYDKYSPSAILKIGGADYLVRSGDDINGYKVLAISRDCVTVQHGANVYKAGVGELLTGSGINFNNVSNLGTKFGGNKKK